MSKSSIYETAWLDLVFEGKNKEYGAYVLRRENSNTTFKALFVALGLLALLSGIVFLLSSFKTETVTKVPDVLGPTIEIHEIIEPIKPPKSEPNTSTVPPAKLEEPKPTLSNPDVVKSIDANPDVPTNSEFPQNNSSPTGVVGGTGTETTSNSGGDTTGIPTDSGTNSTYTTATVDRMPVYPGGMDNFYKYVGRNFKTPEDDMGSTTMVKVLVSFVIEKDGTMSEIKVLRNPGFGLDKEAIRVLKSMKAKWEPGSINGKPVRVVYNLPISVKPAN